MTPQDQALLVSLLAVVLLIVVGAMLSWLSRALLCALVIVTIFVWMKPNVVGSWMVRGRHWTREMVHAPPRH